MKTAGQLLQEARLSQKLNFDDVAKVTRIRPEFLRFIEADNYSHLPSGTVAKGFIANYAKFLGLKSEYVLAVFRRDFLENRQGQIVPRGLAEPVEKVSFWTPKTTVTAVVVAIFLAFSVYVWYQYRLLTGPPPLSLTQPANQVVTTEDNILVVGSTDPEATISVGGQLVALDKGGKFSFRLPLSPGENTIVVTATGKSGKTTTTQRIINFKTQN